MQQCINEYHNLQTTTCTQVQQSLRVCHHICGVQISTLPVPGTEMFQSIPSKYDNCRIWKAKGDNVSKVIYGPPHHILVASFVKTEIYAMQRSVKRNKLS